MAYSGFIEFLVLHTKVIVILYINVLLAFLIASCLANVHFPNMFMALFFIKGCMNCNFRFG